MFSLNKFLPRKSDQDKGHSRSDSNVPKNSEQIEEKDGRTAEGFLCPTCYAAFPNDVQLQNHYESNHSEELEGIDADGRILTCSSCRMKFRSEVELTSHFSRHHVSDKDQGEIEILRMQVQALLEGKALLQNEMESLRSQLVEEAKTSSKAEVEKEVLESKTASLACEIANMKLFCEEKSKEKDTLAAILKNSEDKVKDLETEIRQRPSSDDVVVLKDELVKVQKMMDQLTLQQEAEKEILKKKNVELEMLCKNLNEDRLELMQVIEKTAKVDEFNELNRKFIAMTEQNAALIKEKDLLIQDQQKKINEYKKLKWKLKEVLFNGTDVEAKSETDIEELSKAVAHLKSSLSEYSLLNNSLQAKLNDVEKEKQFQGCETERWKKKAEENLGKVESIKVELASISKGYEQLKEWHKDLLGKIEEGEGQNTALIQLQEENANLRAQGIADHNALLKTIEDTENKHQDLTKKILELSENMQIKCHEISSKQEECLSLKSNLLQKEEAINEMEISLETQNDKIKALESMVDSMRKEIRHRDEVLKDYKNKSSSISQFLSHVEKILESVLKGIKEEIGYTFGNENFDDYLHCKNIISSIKRVREKQFVNDNIVTECYERMKRILEKNEELGKLIKVKDEDLSELKMKLCTLEESSQLAVKELEIKLKNLQSVNDEMESTRLSLNKKVHELVEEKQASQENIDELQNLTKTLVEEKNVLLSERDEFEEKINLLRAEITSLVDQRDSQIAEKMTIKEQLDQTKVVCADLTSNLNVSQGEIDILVKEQTRILSELDDAKSMLTEQNVKLHKEINFLSQENKKALDEMKIEIIAKEKDLQELHQLNENLSTSLENKTKCLDQMEKKHEQVCSDYEAKLNILSENSNTLKADLLSALGRYNELEDKMDEISGIKLELEAKLENLCDERQALLDRCLKSENECEKLLISNSELHAKLEDFNAALHDLGRENQTLQMEMERHLGRKWADDAQVTHCTTCGRTFTVTVRKHHCRNCGKIFCHECSAKTAEVASSKKPVRVCDGCYKELMK